MTTPPLVCGGCGGNDFALVPGFGDDCNAVCRACSNAGVVTGHAMDAVRPPRAIIIGDGAWLAEQRKRIAVIARALALSASRDGERVAEDLLLEHGLGEWAAAVAVGGPARALPLRVMCAACGGCGRVDGWREQHYRVGDIIIPWHRADEGENGGPRADLCDRCDGTGSRSWPRPPRPSLADVTDFVQRTFRATAFDDVVYGASALLGLSTNGSSMRLRSTDGTWLDAQRASNERNRRKRRRKARRR